MGTMKMRSLEDIAKQAADDAMNSLIFTLEDGREFSLREFADYVASGEIVPVRHGRWAERRVDEIEDSTIDAWQSARCMNCGKYHTTPYMYSFTDYKFCPHCGAKMDGGECDDVH